MPRSTISQKILLTHNFYFSVKKSKILQLFFEKHENFLELIFLKKILKISLTSKRRFVAIVSGYNFYEHFTCKKLLIHGQAVEDIENLNCNYFFFENMTIYGLISRKLLETFTYLQKEIYSNCPGV